MFAVTIKSSDTPFLLIGLPPGQFAMSSGGPPPGHPGLPMPQTRGPPPRGSAIGALLNQQRNMPPSTMAQALQDIQQEQVLKRFSQREKILSVFVFTPKLTNSFLFMKCCFISTVRSIRDELLNYVFSRAQQP